MASTNVTPIGAAGGLKAIAEHLREIQIMVNDTFCVLVCASAALEKAENASDGDLWSRAATTVRSCCADLEVIRENVDDATARARQLSSEREEVAHA